MNVFQKEPSFSMISTPMFKNEIYESQPYSANGRSLTAEIKKLTHRCYIEFEPLKSRGPDKMPFVLFVKSDHFELLKNLNPVGKRQFWDKFHVTIRR